MMSQRVRDVVSAAARAYDSQATYNNARGSNDPVDSQETEAPEEEERDDEEEEEDEDDEEEVTDPDGTDPTFDFADPRSVAASQGLASQMRVVRETFAPAGGRGRGRGRGRGGGRGRGRGRGGGRGRGRGDAEEVDFGEWHREMEEKERSAEETTPRRL